MLTHAHTRHKCAGLSLAKLSPSLIYFSDHRFCRDRRLKICWDNTTPSPMRNRFNTEILCWTDVNHLLFYIVLVFKYSANRKISSSKSQKRLWENTELELDNSSKGILKKLTDWSPTLFPSSSKNVTPFAKLVLLDCTGLIRNLSGVSQPPDVLLLLLLLFVVEVLLFMVFLFVVGIEYFPFHNHFISAN